jgi:hypothetical protein
MNSIFTATFRTFAVMSKNVILVDADYVDKVVFELTVNFERMIGRRIPQADMARWIDCIALDGGLRQGEHETQVVLIHDKGIASLKNFIPGDYQKELNGMAFKDNLGEFVFEHHPVEEMTTKTDFFIDALQTICQQTEVERIMVIPDAEHIYNNVRASLRHFNNDKQITVFTMQPMEGGPFRQEILGYSLMAALGVRSEELQPTY